MYCRNDTCQLHKKLNFPKNNTVLFCCVEQHNKNVHYQVILLSEKEFLDIHIHIKLNLQIYFFVIGVLLPLFWRRLPENCFLTFSGINFV